MIHTLLLIPSEYSYINYLFNTSYCRCTGFEGSDSWKDTIPWLFSHQSAPVLVTAYTKKEIKADLLRVRTQSRVTTIEELVEPRVNPFGSRRPLMNFVSDEITPLIFKNAYSMLLRAQEQWNSNNGWHPVLNCGLVDIPPSFQWFQDRTDRGLGRLSISAYSQCLFPISSHCVVIIDNELPCKFMENFNNCVY